MHPASFILVSLLASWHIADNISARMALLSHQVTHPFGQWESDIDRLIEESARRHRVPAVLVRAVLEVESSRDPYAISSSGAMGLMQLKPATAAELGVTDPFDVRQNIDGGAKYLGMLWIRFRGRVRLVIGGYHAGPNASYWTDATRRYIRRVISRMRR